MRKHRLSTPQLGFVVGTRAALAAGAGLLLSARLSKEARRKMGAALVALGALTTLPALRLLARR